MAQFLSKKSRKKSHLNDQLDIPLEKEYQYQFAQDYVQTHDVDYFIFGHRHKPMKIPIEKKATLINLGDWISHFTFVTLEEK